MTTPVPFTLTTHAEANNNRLPDLPNPAHDPSGKSVLLTIHFERATLTLGTGYPLADNKIGVPVYNGAICTGYIVFPDSVSQLEAVEETARQCKWAGALKCNHGGRGLLVDEATIETWPEIRTLSDEPVWREPWEDTGTTRGPSTTTATKPKLLTLVLTGTAGVMWH
ncbi:hypothetical protein H8R18_01175 [Nanchangia anserum]|uniref:hypothetical protein n=1 Tax=Nanchangia anserum TaxID=2692125 RepID=UPI001883E8B8|nr:hypothetical protein [Nanchangia anserum]QOX82016.1 hypothetical protein H8R18_01175 [Nanchangia anserum]